VGQNHIIIRIYGVHTVFLAGKSPYIRSYMVIYGAYIRSWPTIIKDTACVPACERENLCAREFVCKSVCMRVRVWACVPVCVVGNGWECAFAIPRPRLEPALRILTFTLTCLKASCLDAGVCIHITK